MPPVRRIVPRFLVVPRLLVVPVVVGLVLTGCSGDDDDASGATSSSRATTSTAAATSTTTSARSSTTGPTTPDCPPLPGATTGATEATSTAGTANLTDVQLTSGDCTDVVTFTFTATSPDAPGYRVEYQPGPITQDASGEPVTVAGGAYLVVRFEPAYGYDFEQGQPTYTGPTRIPAPGAFFVREVVQTGDFEAVLTWVIGVDQQRGYTVTGTGTTTRTVTIELR
jgi:hypothetical protein